MTLRQGPFIPIEEFISEICLWCDGSGWFKQNQITGYHAEEQAIKVVITRAVQGGGVTPFLNLKGKKLLLPSYQGDGTIAFSQAIPQSPQISLSPENFMALVENGRLTLDRVDTYESPQDYFEFAPDTPGIFSANDLQFQLGDVGVILRGLGFDMPENQPASRTRNDPLTRKLREFLKTYEGNPVDAKIDEAWDYVLKDVAFDEDATSIICPLDKGGDKTVSRDNFAKRLRDLKRRLYLTS